MTPDAGTGSNLAVMDQGSESVQSVASPLPEGWMHGAFMQIYVRGYKDSNGDGKGDLQGLISQLDYLQDLGVQGLWLMPVTQSEDHDHGYAVKNYRDIESDYGSQADMAQLLAQAHQRSMGVILDHVINHASSQHPLFLNAASARLSPQRPYFVWQDTAPTGWRVWGGNPWYSSGNGYYYAPFWSGMPDFNWKNEQVKIFHHDNLRYWLNQGVDGFRFDAVGSLVENGPTAWESQPENHTIMGQVQDLLKSYDKRYMVCEAPAAAQAFGAVSSCGGAFAFDLKDNILRAARGDSAAVVAVSQYFRTAPVGMTTFLANHDSFAGDRVWNQLSGNLAQYKMAAATYLLLPGTPFIYYGEEIGMANGAGISGDWALRTPMSWTGQATGFTTGVPFRALSANITVNNVQAQRGVDGSLHSFYKTLIGLRKRLPSLARGDYSAAWTQGTVMGFQRSLTTERTLVLYNYGLSAQTVSLTGLGALSLWSAEYAASSDLLASLSGTASLSLPPQSVTVYRQRN
ncbi:MAG: alpha-amylase family glycosyl hydrolase [Pseudomonadota bacterium]